MVKQVLSFARGVEGERAPVDPRFLLGEIQKMVSETFPKNISFEMLFKPGLWDMLGDRTQLLQVFLNLCVNARDAMSNGGKLTVTVENVTIDEAFSAMEADAKPGPHVAISVRDTGTGMSSEVIEKIFDPFFTTKELGKGTGLGLSTSLAIVSSHGGFIQVRSEVGKGSELRVHIPAAGVKVERVSAPKAPVHRGNGELILVIDDEASIRRITQHTLEAFGYRVILATDGAEAVAIYAQRQSDIAVVLTDIMMPIMDGTAAIQVLCRMNPDVRIIAATGMNFTGRDPKTVSPTVKGFLAKPYSAEALLKMLADVIAAPGA
jgi:CheY-like chemotaxis protein